MFQFSGFAFSRSLGRISGLQPEGFPHSEIHGSKGYLLLPVAYRSLSRPSSPLRAKASAIRSYLLSLLFYNLICRSRFSSMSKNLINWQWTMINEQWPCQSISSNETTECLMLPQPHYLIFKELYMSTWWRIRDSNPWPLACKASALASWANSPLLFGVQLPWPLVPTYNAGML